MGAKTFKQFNRIEKCSMEVTPFLVCVCVCVCVFNIKYEIE